MQLRIVNDIVARAPTGCQTYPGASRLMITADGAGSMVIVNTIAATTTRTRLSGEAVLNSSTYPTGIKGQRPAAAYPRRLRGLATSQRHGESNYTLQPIGVDA